MGSQHRFMMIKTKKLKDKLNRGTDLNHQECRELIQALEHYQSLARQLSLEHALLLSKMPEDVTDEFRSHQIQVCEMASRGLKGVRSLSMRQVHKESEILHLCKTACDIARNVIRKKQGTTP